MWTGRRGGGKEAGREGGREGQGEVMGHRQWLTLLRRLKTSAVVDRLTTRKSTTHGAFNCGVTYCNTQGEKRRDGEELAVRL